jgi:hypothetical protein
MCLFKAFNGITGEIMTSLIRYRYNTMAAESPNGEWFWRIILERDGGYEEILVKQIIVNVPSFSREDEMPVVGRKYHMACHGTFRIEDGTGIIDA